MHYFFAVTIALRAEWFLEDRRKAMDLMLQISKEWQDKIVPNLLYNRFAGQFLKLNKFEKFVQDQHY